MKKLPLPAPAGKYACFPGLRPAVLLAMFMFLYLPVQSQYPVLKVDMDKSGRQVSEVNEPGYISWVIDGGQSDSIIIKGVRVKFTRAGSVGTALKSDWYKAGVQAPWYARLANDGLTVEDGDAGGQIEMRISGLAEGKHTLLTYHNTYSNPLNNTFSPIDIYLDDSLVVDDLMPSNRANTNDEVPTAYLVISATTGRDAVILFAAETSSSASSKNVTISGFELNTPNARYQAKYPDPADGDEHADADTGSLVLGWTAAGSAVLHDIYFGTDSLSLASADHSSPQYLVRQENTTLTVTGLYSMSTYFWRIDEIDSSGVLTRGDIWYFRPRQPAFPDAWGYGRYARGGRGGIVVEVTNLNDDGPGSLREAVTGDYGPRTIVFTVSGMITLSSRLTINQDYITVAGQTAPGKGICLRSAPFGLSGAEDVIIRHLRVRLGSGTTYDGMGMAGSDHCITDHCSISWTIDEAFSSRNAKNISLQRTLIAEPLNVAGHANYPEGTAHGFAASISGDKGSFHHNLLAHSYARNWSLAGGLDGNGLFAGRMDIFNNVVYNWNKRTTEGGAHEVNFVNNYYKRGPAWDGRSDHALMAEYENFPGTQQYYFSGNTMPGVFDSSNQEDGRTYTGTPEGYLPWVDQPFFTSMAEIHSAEDAYKSVLSDVGCTQPVFDDHDLRIITETLAGTHTCTGNKTGLQGIVDSEQDAGGWEDYPEMHRLSNWDSDHDGLPDWWEILYGLNPVSPSGDFTESNADPDLDGYTRLDDYLQWMSQPHFFLPEDQTLDINLQQLSQGYTDNPEYIASKFSNGSLVIWQASGLARFTPEQPGLASFTFTVTDAAGSYMTRTIGICVTEEDMSGIPDKNEKELHLNCYPNPASDFLTVSVFTEDAAFATLVISDLSGRKIIWQSGPVDENHYNISVDVSRLAAGIYLMTVNCEDKQQSLKLLIQ